MCFAYNLQDLPYRFHWVSDRERTSGDKINCIYVGKMFGPCVLLFRMDIRIRIMTLL